MFGRLTLALLLSLLPSCWAASQTDSRWHATRERAGSAGAIIVDWTTGATLLSVGSPVRTTPGSVLKPLLLAYALKHGITNAQHTVYCRGNLRVAGRSVGCTHPVDQRTLDAQSALAESCNTWFAELGRQYTGSQLNAAMAASHLLHHASFLNADVASRQLAVLGLEGVTVAPEELARAYRSLLRDLQPTETVWQGMRDSVTYGMSHPADLPGVNLLGKTGTAAAHGEIYTHGWFVGAVPGRYVLVVYVPRGDGGDAARIAKQMLEVAPQ